MPDTSSTITVVFKGQAQSLDEAMKQIASGFGQVGKAAEGASTQTKKVAGAAKEVEAEATGLSRGIEVAADAMGLFNREAGETTTRMFEMRNLAADMRGAFGNMRAAIVGGAAAFATVGAVSFLKSSVDEALQGEQAQAKLNAALKGNQTAIAQVNKATEDGAQQWAKYGVTVGQLKGILAGAIGRGVDPNIILGNAKAFADLKIALGTDIPGAIDAVTNGPRGARALSRALNLNKQDAVALTDAMNVAYTANQRVAVGLSFVEKSRFAGQGNALANTDTGKMVQFQTSMKDLEETLGGGVLPLIANFANILNGMIQTANQLLSGFGGLSGVLSSKWVPIVALGLVGLKGFFSILGLIQNLLQSKYLGTLAATRQEMDQDTKSATDYVTELDAIPQTVDTSAVFDAATAMTTKDAYIANIERLMALSPVLITSTFTPPANMITTESGIIVPVKAGAADTAGVAADEAAMQAAATPITVPVKAGAADTAGVAADEAAMQAEATAHPVVVPVKAGVFSGVGQIAAFAGITATVSQVIFNPKARQDIANAVGHLTGHVTAIKENKGVHAPAVNVTGHITGLKENKGVHAPTVDVTGHINGWVENKGVSTPPVRVKGHINGWVENKGVHAPAVNVTGHINQLDIAKGTPIPTFKTGETVHIKGAVKVNATANVTSATVPHGTRLIVPGGLSVNGVQVPKGTALMVDVKGRVTGVVVPTSHGKAIEYNVPVTAKVHVDAGTLSSVFGTPNKPIPMYVKPVLPKGYHLPGPTPPKAPTPPSQSPLDNPIAQAIEFAVVSALVGKLVSKFPAGNVLKSIKDIFGGKGGPPSGGVGSQEDIDPALYGELQQLAKAADYPGADTGKPAKGPLPPYVRDLGKPITGGPLPQLPSEKWGWLTGPLQTMMTGALKAMSPNAIGIAIGVKLRDAIGSISVGAIAKAGALVGIGGAFLGLLANVIKGAAALGGRALGGTEGAVVSVFTAVFGNVQKALNNVFRGSSGGPRGTAIINMAPLIASISEAIVQAFVDGLEGAKSALASAITTFFKNLAPSISVPHPSTHGQSVDIPGATDPHNKPPAAPGYTVEWDSKTRHWMQVPRHPGHSSLPAGANGFGASLLGGPAGQSLAQQLANTVHLQVPHGHGAQAPAKSGGNTLHATFNIYGATNPQAVSEQVRRELQEFVKAL